jgi:hypothetical protein
MTRRALVFQAERMNGSIRLSSLILLGLLLLPRLVSADALRLDLEFLAVEKGENASPTHVQIWIDGRRIRIETSSAVGRKPAPVLICRGEADPSIARASGEPGNLTSIPGPALDQSIDDATECAEQEYDRGEKAE